MRFTTDFVRLSAAQVEFEKPDMTLDALMAYGQSLVQAQENVQRVQLAESYLSGAELAGLEGKSIPDELMEKIEHRQQKEHEKSKKPSLLG